MAKQLNVALDFTANTTQAKQQIQELQQLLTKVAYSTDLGIDSSQMKEASAAAKELAVHLNEAYNQKTGNYDLSKLNASLAKSKTSVTELSTSLLQAGTTGQQAFIKLAQSIAAADQPMITLNARLQDFLTTVKNTVKWQISSSMIHGVMGALQGAYHYAQDLNSSLNDIRIVTGHNIDYMDKFADKANKAAKALSTSTLNYTDASLIYYQQGLSDQEVEDRTAVTIKMANAAGESADKVSEQLTAVWNNFYDGSQSLEYYADVMTALGAATASSTDEIAEGLEKFAAVSNTVGLSYEYATSALATVTATTRQSADVVGTAFKTLFARIQDLELGETLDDGTTLGKYSQALETVGVAIKTADGGLRDMDDILSDLGEKWNSLDAEGNPLISKDAKVALAQTVAGVRQYTQLMALMDNWDFMKENLETARNATGTLTEQQKIYEESWKAANKRLKASFESLYTDLIEDKFFIKLTDFLSDMVDGVDLFIDKIGGVKPLLLGILSIIASTLSSKIQPAINNAINNIKILVGGADKAYAKIHDDLNKTAKANWYNEDGTHRFNPIQEEQLRGVQRITEAKQRLSVVEKNLTATEKAQAESAIQGFELQQKHLEDLIKKQEELKQKKKDFNSTELDTSTISINTKRIDQAKRSRVNAVERDINSTDIIGDANTLARSYESIQYAADNAANAVKNSAVVMLEAWKESVESGKSVTLSGADVFKDLIENMDTSMQSIKSRGNDLSSHAREVREGLNVMVESLPEGIRLSGDFSKAMNELDRARGPQQTTAAIQKLIKIISNAKIETKDLEKYLKSIGYPEEKLQNYLKLLKEQKQNAKEAAEAQETLNNAVKNFKPQHKIAFSEGVVSLASACGSAVMALESLKSIMETISDPESTRWEKFSAVLMGFSMIVPSLMSAFSGFGKVIAGVNQIVELGTVVWAARTGVEVLNTSVLGENTTQLILNTLANSKLTDENKKNLIALILRRAGLSVDTAALHANNLVTGTATVVTKSFSAALKELWASLVPLLPVIVPLAIALGALVAAWAIYDNATGAAAENAKQNNKNLEETKTALDDVNSRLNTLNSTLSGLNDKRKNIDNLTYGTIEWRDAVNELNDEVDDLIEKYGLIKGQDWDIDAQGRKYITDTGAETMRTSMDEERSNLLSAKAAQQKFKDKYEYDQNKKEIVSDYTKRGQTHYDNNVEQITSKDLDTIVNAKLRNPSLEINPNTLKDLGLDQSVIDLIDNNSALQDAIEALTVQAQRIADIETNDMYNKMVSEGILEDLKEAGVSDEYASDIAYKMAEDAVRNSNAADYVQKAKELTPTTDYSYFSDKNPYIQQFLEENGWTYKDSNNWGNFGKLEADKTIEVYTDEDKKETKNISASQIRAWLENELASQDTIANVDDYVGIEADSKTTWESASKAKETWDKNQSTVNEFLELRDSGVPQIEGYDEETLNNSYQAALESKASEVGEVLKQNSEEYAKMFDMTKEGFEDWISDSDNIIENFDLIQKAINGDAEAVNELRKKTGLNIGTIEDIQEAWNDNSKALDKYAEKLSKGVELTESEYDAFGDFLNANSDSFSQLAGVSEETFDKILAKDKDFIKKAGPLIPKMMQGNKEAYAKFRIEAQKKIMIDADTSPYIAKLRECGEYSQDQIDTMVEQLSSAFDTLADLADSKQIGVRVDDSEAIAACQRIVNAFGWTADEAVQEMGKMGYNLEVEPSEPVEETTTVQNPIYEHYGPDGCVLPVPIITGYEDEEITTMVEPPPTVQAITYDGAKFGGETVGNNKNSPTNNNTNDNNPSGGGGNSYTPPPKKEYKDEIERYHVIKQKIEDLQEVMDHLAKAKERAFGTSKLELMDQEIEKYDEMIDLQNQYLDEINKYWDEDRALIASYGAEFDETGAITNYDEIMKRQINKYNSSIGKNEEADKAAEEAYDDFIEALEQYEETNNLRQDELEKLYDLQTELADVIFEKTQYKIEIKIAVKDDELEYLDYLLSKIEDDAYSAAEAIALIGEKAENALEKTKTYSDGLLELLNNHGINSIEELDKLTVDDLKAKNFTEDEIDQIREWRSSILEANQELLEMRATIQEKVLDSFNQFSEDIQDQIDLFEHYQNILEGVKDITFLLGAQLNEQSKLVLRNLNRSLMNNSINNLAGAKQQVEALKQMRADAQEQYDKAVANEDSIGIKRWSDTLKEIDKQVHDAEENFLDTWQEALERAHDIFEEEMDNIVKEFEDGISPIYGSIEALQDAITRANELNDQYLSDADKTYELNKLRRQIKGSIDDTDIIPHKQALNKLQDELNKKLKDGSKISEYDLKILQSKYELELARQKLEDVQNSNETVRLTRDNNGNWGYVYSADEDKIAEAEQEYEDKLNAYQKANEEYLKTLENNILQLQSDYQEKLTAIKLSFTQGEISQAEYEKQAADLEKYYDERMQQIHQQYEEVFKNSKDANEKFVAYYKDSSGALVDSFDQTTLALKTGYSTLDEMFNAFWKSHDNYVADSNKLLDDYLNKIKEINSTAGIEGSFADEASGWSIKITGESDKAVADMEKIVKNATDSFNDVIKAASDWESIYVSKIDSAIKRNEALVKTMNEMVAALSGMQSIDYSKYENAIDSRSTATANNIISTQHNSESFNKSAEIPDYISQFSYLDMLDQLDINKQIEGWMNNNELNIDTALMDSLDISTILQSIGLNVQTIVNYLSNLIPSSLGVDRIAQEFMQQVSINADFPNVTDSNEIMEAFEMMENEASQYASRKTI